MRDGLPALADGGGRPPLGDRPPSAPAPWRGMFDDTTTAGRGCDIVHVFCRTDDPAWARQAVGEIVAQARLPLLTVEPWTWPTDAEIAAMAGAIRACGSRPVWVRFGHEMNGDWYPWSGDSVRYVREWQRFYSAMPGNVRAVWCPNCQPVEGVGRWMPPLAEIDVVGIDGYAQTADQSFGDVFGASIHALRGLAPGKPLAICETACPRGPRQRRWVEGMWGWIGARAPEVEAVCWFNKDKERDWRLGPAARRAFLAEGAGR